MSKPARTLACQVGPSADSSWHLQAMMQEPTAGPDSCTAKWNRRAKISSVPNRTRLAESHAVDNSKDAVSGSRIENQESNTFSLPCQAAVFIELLPPNATPSLSNRCHTRTRYLSWEHLPRAHSTTPLGDTFICGCGGLAQNKYLAFC